MANFQVQLAEMAHTVPAEYIGEQHVGYSFTAFFSPRATKELMLVQQELRRRLGDAVWLTPSPMLHITICELVQFKAYTQDKEYLFQKGKTQFMRVAEHLAAQQPPLMVAFDSLVVSPHAIIATAHDDGSVQRFREKLLAGFSLPEETASPPQIIHTTLARHMAVQEVGDVQTRIADIPIKFSFAIDHFQLIRYKVVPLLAYDVIATYPFARM